MVFVGFKTSNQNIIVALAGCTLDPSSFGSSHGSGSFPAICMCRGKGNESRKARGSPGPRQTRPACAKSGGVKPPTGPSCRCEHRPGAACLITSWLKTREKARLHASGRVPLSGAQPSLPDPSQRLQGCVFLSHLHPAANLNPPHNPPPHNSNRQSRAEDSSTTPQPWRSCR